MRNYQELVKFPPGDTEDFNLSSWSNWFQLLSNAVEIAAILQKMGA
jgi:hypothetical protein